MGCRVPCTATDREAVTEAPLQARRLNVWDEPLSDNERAIINQVLKTGSGNDARRWLTHLLKVYDAREASRV